MNINFISCKFSGNDRSGFLFCTTKMNSSSRPVSVKVVDSEFSNNMVSPGARAEIFIGGGLTANPVGGEIRFEKIKFNGSRNTLCGIHFENFDIQYSRNVPFMHINAPRTFAVKDVTGSFDIQEPNDNALKYSGGYRSSANQNVSVDYDHN